MDHDSCDGDELRAALPPVSADLPIAIVTRDGKPRCRRLPARVGVLGSTRKHATPPVLSFRVTPSSSLSFDVRRHARSPALARHSAKVRHKRGNRPVPYEFTCRQVVTPRACRDVISCPRQFSGFQISRIVMPQKIARGAMPHSCFRERTRPRTSGASPACKLVTDCCSSEARCETSLHMQRSCTRAAVPRLRSDSLLCTYSRARFAELPHWGTHSRCTPLLQRSGQRWESQSLSAALLEHQ